MDTENTKIMKLRRPLLMPGDDGSNFPKIEEIELREPRAKDLILASADANAVRQQVLLISSIIRQPSIMVRRMATADFNEACAYLNPFTDRPTVEGPTTSPNTMPLLDPVATDTGAPVKELTIAEPTVDKMIAAADDSGSGSRIAFEAALLAQVSNTERSTIERLCARDFLRALTIMNLFLAPSPATGPNSSAT